MVSFKTVDSRSNAKPRILLGVTSAVSLSLMRGFPEFLSERGWDVHVVSGPGSSLNQLSHREGVTGHQVSMVRDPAPWRDLHSLVAWISLIRQVKPDVVSVGTPKAGLLGGFASVVNQVPCRVYMLRGLRLETTGGAKRALLKALEQLAMMCAHSVLAVSPSLKQRVINLRLVSADKVVVLGSGSSNGVDIAGIDAAQSDIADLQRMRSALGIDAVIPVVGFVGRLTRDKGLNVLADARKILLERSVDHQLLLVGSVDDASGGEVVKRLMSTGRAPVQPGSVENPAPYYQMMDVFCLPSLREGFPNVVLEAGASGLPTVTTDATGSVDSIVDGVTGLLATANDARSLADRLEVLLRDAELRQSMGDSARDHVVAKFDRIKVWESMEAFYRETMLSSRGSVRRSAGQRRRSS